MTAGNPEKNSFRDLLKASWVKTSIKLGMILTAAAIITIWLLKTFNVAATPIFSNMETFFLNYGLAGIFFATILAGTVIPLGSPALVAIAAFFVDPFQLILVASTGFTLGMTINYTFAYKLGRPYVSRKISTEQLGEIDRAWNKWGIALFIIFGLTPVLPVELLSFICGLLKTHIAKFLVISFIPRLIVFALIVYFGKYIGAWIGA